MSTGQTEIPPAQATKPKRKKWKVPQPWLYIPFASVVALILGINASLVLAAISPLERGISLGIAVLVGPLIAGAAINQLVGAKRQWCACGLTFLLTLVLAGMAWSLNTLLWS